MARECQTEGVERKDHTQIIMSSGIDKGPEPCWNPLDGAIRCTVFENESNDDDAYWETCLESCDTFFKAIKVGRPRGVTAVIGNADDNPLIMPLVRKLLQYDIFPIVSGCTKKTIDHAERTGLSMMHGAGDGLSEFCTHLDLPLVMNMSGCLEPSRIIGFYKALADHAKIPVKELPVAISAPDWYLSHVAPISGCAVTTDLYDTGSDLDEAVQRIDEYIHDRRLDLGWCDRLHCSIHTYS